MDLSDLNNYGYVIAHLFILVWCTTGGSSLYQRRKSHMLYTVKAGYTSKLHY